jgi:hypothetical protein
MAIAALVVAVVATPFGGGIGGRRLRQLLDGPLRSGRPTAGSGSPRAPACPRAASCAGGEEARIAVPDAVLTLADGAELGTDPDDPSCAGAASSSRPPSDSTCGSAHARPRARGQWRVDTGAASRVATYRGLVELDDGARTARLARYRQVAGPEGALQDGRRPLRYLVGDDWDERLLAEAFAVDRLAERLTESLGRSPRRGAPQPGVLRGVRRRREERSTAALDRLAGVEAGRPLRAARRRAARRRGDRRPDGEGGLEAEVALERMIALRRAGATWGLVLVEHDLASGDLRAAADRALERVEEDPPPRSRPSRT